MRSLSRSLTVAVGPAWAMLVLGCGERYTGPFRDPNAPVIPSFADSAFGAGATKWFAARTPFYVQAAALDAQSVYSIEVSTLLSTSLVALNITNGAYRWARTVPSRSYDIISIAGNVAAIADTVVAFDATTGAPKFRYAPSGPRRVTSNGATDGAQIIVGNAAGEIVGLNATTGAEVWKVALDTAAVFGVTVSGGVAYAGGFGFLAAVTIATGALKWKHVTTDNPRPSLYAGPAVDSGRVTVPTFLAPTYGIANYDALTGALSWSAANVDPTPSFFTPGQPVCDGLVFTYTPASLDARSTSTGVVAWSKGLNPFMLLSASCSYSTVIVNSERGQTSPFFNEVLILGASAGNVLAQYPKTAGQQLRVHRVVRNASAIYFFTATGISAILAP